MEIYKFQLYKFLFQKYQTTTTNAASLKFPLKCHFPWLFSPSNAVTQNVFGQDWEERFQRQLGKTVVELTGDFTPDVTRNPGRGKCSYQ
jgi:hypothetical protein